MSEWEEVFDCRGPVDFILAGWWTGTGEVRSRGLEGGCRDLLEAELWGIFSREGDVFRCRCSSCGQYQETDGEQASLDEKSYHVRISPRGERAGWG